MEKNCWICGSDDLKLYKKSTLGGVLCSEDFRITEVNYGYTAQIDRCESCGFKQCTDLREVLPFYKDLVDPAYDEGRKPRALQARKTLEEVIKWKPKGKFLDIGAASGILVEEAGKMKFEAEGIEPSDFLHNLAIQRGLKVHKGTFPNSKTEGPYDVISVIDVIEHVPDPVGMLRDVKAAMKDDGIGVISTPDVESFVARILGKRWWHFRVAHIGYFSKKTFKRAFDEAGLELLSMSSPPWYFPIDYWAYRIVGYLPEKLRFRLPKIFEKIIVRLNFFDSFLVVFKKK